MGTSPAPGTTVQLRGIVHLEGIGDVPFVNDEMAGTEGESRRLEGFELSIDPPVPDLGLEYMAHVENIGDMPWAAGGDFVGTRDRGLRLEGFAIQLTGGGVEYYVVNYRAWLQDTGMTDWYANGDFCGTRGQERRVEAMEVHVGVPYPANPMGEGE